MTTFDMNRVTENAFKNMDIYAIYLRKSRADEKAEKLGEGETLARHEKILTKLAADEGLYVGKIYKEIVSGDTIEARPEIQKLIQDCYDGKYKGIIIIDVTRLSRGNQGDAQTIMDCLKYSNRNSGVLVVTPTKTYDIAHNQEDEEYMEFELFMSRREYKMIRKRMDRGRKQSVVEGNYIGTYRPYGYDIVKTPTARTLTPNEHEAPVVKQIFEWFTKEGLTTFKIAQRLTAMGIPTYKGEDVWSKQTIRDYLSNPVYMGKVRWNNRMTIKTMVNGELKKIRPRIKTDQHMIYDGKHKKHALVDEETFKEAQKKFYSDRTRSDMKLKNPIASMMFCKKCGTPMFLQPYKPPRVARYSHRSSTIKCTVKSAIATDVMDAVTHGLKMYMDDFQLKVDNSSPIESKTIDLKIKSLEKEIAKIVKKKNNLFDMRENEEITNNEFVERKAMHDNKLEVLYNQIEELKDKIPAKENYEETLLRLTDAWIAITDPEMDAADKNMFLKKIISKIEFSRENDQEFILDIDLRY